eukprot:755760-Heterocapsa_arctica.AAC.1
MTAVPADAPKPELPQAVMQRFKKAIQNAETLEEITRLERALQSGILLDSLKEMAPPRVVGRDD